MSRNPEFAMDAAWLESEWGIVTPFATDYLPREYRHNWALAQDAQPTLVTTPNAGVPSWLTQYVDPEMVRVLQTPNRGAEILGEEKRGDWTTDTAWFPMIENTGEVSSYGDFNQNGRADVNAQFESRQSYLFQTIIEYGDREVERAGLARLNLVAEKQVAAAKILNKFADYTYHFGVQGLQNYGILNDPSLPAALTPTTKAAGGAKWVNNGQINAQAGEVYADFQLLFNELQAQSGGLIDMDSELILVFPNTVSTALTATNQYGITVRNLIKESFPNVTYVVDPRYATTAGNVVQLIARNMDGQRTGYCAFNEKMRDHLAVRALSSYQQKRTSGSWGAIIRYPLSFAQLIGV